MNIVFLGTPEFGADVLRSLISSAHKVVAVVCQPDRAGNRNKVEVCPVKKLAQQHNLDIYQFENISKDGVSVLKQIAANIFVTAAYGQLLSREVLSIPKHGVYNVHGSLLPEYRGAAPVQFALLNGNKKTGVTIMKTALAMDSGDVALQKSVDIEEADNAETLLKKLAKLGGEALQEVLWQLQNNMLKLQPQDESKATFCKKITAEMAKINWNNKNLDIFNQIRAFNPSPVAYTVLNGDNFRIFDSRPTDCNIDAVNGQVIECSKLSLTVKCGSGALKLLSVQAAGGKVLGYKDFINGRKIKQGDILG